MTATRPTFYSAIAANRRASWALMLAVTLLLVALGGTAGYAFGYGWAGIPFAIGLAAILGASSYFGGDRLVLAASAAKEIERSPFIDKGLRDFWFESVDRALRAPSVAPSAAPAPSI